MDGARFANAVVHCGCAPAALTWQAGVDALSFGFVKNGGMSAEALVFFKPSGYFVPGVHTRPLSDDDPDIAPDLVPLRRGLMELVKRPVNIQASREIVIQFRGDLLDQPYLILFEKPGGGLFGGPVPDSR